MKPVPAIFLITLLIPLAAVSQQAATVESLPNPQVADSTHFVCNPDGIIDSQTEQNINALLLELRRSTRAEVAVVAVSSIGTDTEISDFAYQLFNHWGIGDKNMNNGLLLLCVADRKQIRFTTGLGTEGVLPDAICKRIQTLDMLPHFREGNYSLGIYAGVEKAAEYIEANPVEYRDTSVWSNSEPQYSWKLMLCFAIVVLVLIASWSLYLVDRRCREIHADSSLANNEQRYTAMEGYVCFGSVFFVLFVGAIILSFFVLKVYAAPFVIDFLALIPAYKRKNALLQRLRSESFPCDKCGNLMEQKSEEEDNAFLDPRSDMEDSLMSVDADVFVCGKCGNVAIYKYESRSCKYSRCPQCQVKAYFKESSRITVQPAVQREGIQEDIYRCLYCNYSRKVEKRLPAEPDTSAASLVAGAIIGSALGGGNRGGGSFGGGSFGGGRSGGGGATSGW